MNLSKRLAKRLLLVGLLSLCLVGLNGPYEKIAFGQNKLPDVNPQALLDMASARAEVTSEWETVFGLFHATSEELHHVAQGKDVFEYSDIAKGYLEGLAEQLEAMCITPIDEPVLQRLNSICPGCSVAYRPYNEAMAVWSLSQCADKLRRAAAKLLEILQQFSQSRCELLYHHDWALETDVHWRYESIVTEGEMWEAYKAGTLAAPEENPERKAADFLNGEVEALQILKTAIEDKIASVMDKSGGFADSYGIYDLLDNFKKFVQSDLDYLAAVIELLGPINTAPSATSQSLTTDEDTAVDIVLTGDDPDGDPLTFRIITQPTNGSLTGAAPNVTYTPNPDYNGSDGFTFMVNDGTVDSEPATVSITINPVNDKPAVSTADLFIKEDTPGRIKVEISDVDGDALTADVFGGPHFGRLTGKLPNLTYIPNKDYNGMDTFTVIARDGVASGKASVNIFIDPVNDKPVANPQSVTTNEDTPLPITLTGSDVDGDKLTFSIGSKQPSNGSLTGSGAQVTYTPNKDWPTGHGSANDSFTFTVSDGKLSDTATISITVIAVDDKPIANPQSVTTNEDTSLVITLSGSDVDGDTLSFSFPNQTNQGGTLTGTGRQGGNQVQYDPKPDWPTGHNISGLDSFTFQVDDGWGGTNTAPVTITVNAVNDPPVAYIDSIWPSPAPVGWLVILKGHGTNVDGPGDVVTYTWDFGDNKTQFGTTDRQGSSSVSHQYTAPGLYRVEFNVQDSFVSSKTVWRMLKVESASSVTFLAMCNAPGISLYININVDINVTPTDMNGSAGGKTPFTRDYSTGTLVTVTAPETYWERKQNADGTWQTLYGTFHYWSDGSDNRVGEEPYPRTISFSKLPTGETYTANYDLDGGNVGLEKWCPYLVGNTEYIWSECAIPGPVHIHNLNKLIPVGGGYLIVEFAPDNFNGCPDTVTVSISPDKVTWTPVSLQQSPGITSPDNGITSYITSNNTCPNNPTPCWVHAMPESGYQSEAFRFVKISIPSCYIDYSAAYVCLRPPSALGETVTLTVKAVAEVIMGWLGDIPVTRKVPENVHVTVNNQIPKEVTPFSKNFPKNSEVTLEAERRITRTGTTYFFDRWEIDGKVDSKREITITLTEDTTCTAFYLPPDWELPPDRE